MSISSPSRLCLCLALPLLLAALRTAPCQVVPTTTAPFSGTTDRLAVLPPLGTRGRYLSVTDPTRGNNDGFLGGADQGNLRSYPYVTTTDYVLFEEDRPGVLTYAFRTFLSEVGLQNFPWAATIENYPFEIRRNGLSYPDFSYDVKEFFSGQAGPFQAPLVWYAAGGYNSRHPLAFDRLKLSVPRSLAPDGLGERNHSLYSGDPSLENVDGPRFWQFYSVHTPMGVPSPVPTPSQLATAFNRSGGWPHDTPANWSPIDSQVYVPGQRKVVHTTATAGAFLGLRFQVMTPLDYSFVWIKIRFDGDELPSVEAPIGMLCGGARPHYPIQSVLFGNNGNLEIACYYPMPFRKSAVIEIENRSPFATQIALSLSEHAGPYPEPFGTFTTEYRSERPTTTGIDFVTVQRRGRGKMGSPVPDFETPIPHNIHELTYLEGDFSWVIDGLRGDRGQATETEFGMAWYESPADVRFSTPIHGNSGLEIAPRLSTFGVDQDHVRSHYALFLGDVRAYHESLLITQEHGMFNDVNVHIASLACLYEHREPAMDLVQVIDVGDAASEQESLYQAPGSTLLPPLTNRYLGDDTLPLVTDEGRVLGVESSFTLQIPTANRGIHLQVRVDRAVQDGKVGAALWVNGQLVERVSRIVRNDFYRWQDLSFEIPEAMSAGQSSLAIRIVPYAGQWNEYHWRAFAYRPSWPGLRRVGQAAHFTSSPVLLSLGAQPISGTTIPIEIQNVPPLSDGVVIVARDLSEPLAFVGPVPLYVHWPRDAVLLLGMSDASGRATIPLGIPDGLTGECFHLQALWLDQSAPVTPPFHSAALTLVIAAP
ncbi:MAG TPA: DUF2961 domain-containing protein [Planctomycetota bacterium]|nr:DUF2961 domain-containing protein [Planctomycetota bacterium]